MILYGSGEPIAALGMVQQRLTTVHCKDGAWPTEEGKHGTERPLGQGDVGLDRYVAKLKEICYQGPLVIEREITGEAQRKDILGAIGLLEGLRKA
jgi:sugar phosphate isomerase/epimerase